MKDLLKRTFEGEFNESHYKELVLNLFNRFDFSKGHTLKHQFTEAEKQALNDFSYLGTYDDSQNKSLDVLIAELKGGSKVERARSLQRNLIGKYLKSNLKDSALVAFYSKDNPDWRLSFVKMDYRLDEKGAKVEIGTPPKRYSFLVGKTEPSHTAQKQLLPLLDDKKIPAIDEIEKLFSIEKVTKEFYTEIAKKFTELVGGERKIGSKKVVEKGCIRLPSTNDDTIEKEFAVRLIGRLLFCWFLKKKKSETGEPLLTSVLISSDAVNQEKNYYHRFLEPLFFQVLNTPQEKRKDCFKHEFWGKIPFLNGGLFEPHCHDFYESTEPFGHSKHINTLKIPDEWFLELFKLFELYNFTIDESTTIDVDISVDPEMLGRIFENLLAEINPQTGETARKSTGSYYTPRPIVEYMVDESLKQYLKTQTGINEVKLTSLLSYAEDAEGFNNESEEDSIIDALDRVKIIDPACGSGAFPMGILHKMLLILQKIDPESKKWLTRKLARIDNKLLRKELESKLKSENWDYVHKLGIIQNSIYGVDIQPIAVEISKLRFFLSLVVDEKIDDKKPNRGVVPLPNLEFKFVAANSLIGLPKAEGGFAESHSDIEKLRELRESYFTAYGEDKRRVEAEFAQTQDRMFRHALNWQATGSQTYKLSEWNPFADEAASWFDPEWMFGVTDGFDVVIGNPPYVLMQSGNRDNTLNKYFRQNYKVASYKLDLYHFFIELGVNVLKQAGTISFITPSNFTSNNYTVPLRRFLLTETAIEKLVFFGEGVFDASVHNLVFVAHKQKPVDANTCFCKAEIRGSELHVEEQSKIKQAQLVDDMCLLVLRTGNAAESVIRKMSQAYESFGSVSSVNFGMQLRDRSEFKQDVVESPASKSSLTKFHRKCYAGKDVHRFYVTFADRYCYFNREAKRGGCWDEDIHDAKNKILVRQIGDYPEGGLDTCGYAVLNAAFMILPKTKSFDSKFLLGVLNSAAIRFYWLNKFRDDRKTFPKIKGEYLKLLPLPKVDLEKQAPIVLLVDQILTAKKKDPNAGTSALEKQIDEMIYALYGLTPDEIAIVEGGGK